MASAGDGLVREKHLGTSDSTKAPPLPSLFEGSRPKGFSLTFPTLLYMLSKDACEIGARTRAELD